MLIYLADLVHNFHPGLNVVPLNIANIAAYSKQCLGDDVEIVLFKYCEDLLAAIDSRQPSLVGLSNYTWNEALNDFVGRSIKNRFPGMPIVMGGPNIRRDSDGIRSFLVERSYVDVYISNEGERPFAALLKGICSAHAGGGLTGESVRAFDIPSCFSIVGTDLKGAHAAEEITSLDYLPSPYTTGLLDKFLKTEFIPIFESNRGCPYFCTYCNWGGGINKKLRTFSPERISSEMEYVAKRGVEFPHWIVADANFGILARDVEIAQDIRDIYERYRPFLSISIYWDKSAKGNMVKIATILKGLSNAYIAFQTFDPVVEKMIKRKNISMEKLLEVIEPLSSISNRLHTDVLLGLPGETMASHLASLGKAYELGFDSIGGGEIRLLKGSELETDESRNEFGIKTKYRLIQEGFGLYRGEFVAEFEESVRATKWITEDEMLKLRVLRAIFYGAVTIGELGPLAKYLKKTGVNVLDLIRLIVEMKDADPLVAESINWLSDQARNEWHCTKEAAADFISVAENREKLLKNPVAKLNCDFLSYLMLSREKYDAFHAYVRMIIAQRFPSANRSVVDEISMLCRERNYVVRCLRGLPEPRARVNLSVETMQVLVDIGYLRGEAGSFDAGNGLVLVMDESMSRSVRDLLQASTPVIQTLSLISQRLRQYMSPAAGGLPAVS